MVNVHAHGKAARAYGVFNLAENFCIVFMRLYNFDSPCLCSTNLFKFFVAAHADPMHRTGFLRRGDAEGEDKVRQALARAKAEGFPFRMTVEEA